MSFPHQGAGLSGAFPADERRETAGDTELDELRRDTARARRRFAIVNAACFALVLLLDCTAGDLPAHGVFGRINLGMILGAGQGVLLLATAWRYDRETSRHCDPRADRIRVHAEYAARQADQASGSTAAADRSPATRRRTVVR